MSDTSRIFEIIDSSLPPEIKLRQLKEHFRMAGDDERLELFLEVCMALITARTRNRYHQKREGGT